MDSTNGDASKRVLAERKGYLMEIKSSINLMVMSFNMRCSSARDGINAFENRKPRIEEMLNRYSPDVIGFQEVRDETFPQLKFNLSEYTFLGYGRDAHFFGESARIAFARVMEDVAMN